MPISQPCLCGKILQAPDAARGRQGKCPGCGRLLTIGQPVEMVAAPTALWKRPAILAPAIVALCSTIAAVAWLAGQGRGAMEAVPTVEPIADAAATASAAIPAVPSAAPYAPTPPEQLRAQYEQRRALAEQRRAEVQQGLRPGDVRGASPNVNGGSIAPPNLQPQAQPTRGRPPIEFDLTRGWNRDTVLRVQYGMLDPATPWQVSVRVQRFGSLKGTNLRVVLPAGAQIDHRLVVFTRGEAVWQPHEEHEQTFQVTAYLAAPLEYDAWMKSLMLGDISPDGEPIWLLAQSIEESPAEFAPLSDGTLETSSHAVRQAAIYWATMPPERGEATAQAAVAKLNQFAMRKFPALGLQGDDMAKALAMWQPPPAPAPQVASTQPTGGAAHHSPAATPGPVTVGDLLGGLFGAGSSADSPRQTQPAARHPGEVKADMTRLPRGAQVKAIWDDKIVSGQIVDISSGRYRIQAAGQPKDIIVSAWHVVGLGEHADPWAVATEGTLRLYIQHAGKPDLFFPLPKACHWDEEEHRWYRCNFAHEHDGWALLISKRFPQRNRWVPREQVCTEAEYRQRIGELRNGVSMGDAEAALRLHWEYLRAPGDEQEFGQGKNYPTASRYLAQAAEGGLPEGMFHFGQWQLSESRNGKVDYQAAFHWLREAAELEHVRAASMVSRLCRTPEAEVPDDEEHRQLAVRFARFAAMNGDADAMWDLGQYYYYGVALPRDRQKAELWMAAAAAGGSNEALGYALGRALLEPENLVRMIAEAGVGGAKEDPWYEEARTIRDHLVSTGRVDSQGRFSLPGDRGQ